MITIIIDLLAELAFLFGSIYYGFIKEPTMRSLEAMLVLGVCVVIIEIRRIKK
jgi:hypothetical protein